MDYWQAFSVLWAFSYWVSLRVMYVDGLLGAPVPEDMDADAVDDDRGLFGV